MTKVLVSDPIDQTGIDILSQVAQVDLRTGLPPNSLWQMHRRLRRPDDPLRHPGDRRGAGGRRTRLKIIGRAGVGVDNVDVKAATRTGCWWSILRRATRSPPPSTPWR
jgi:D-3-phosphoglycerate dehydrogenase